MRLRVRTTTQPSPCVHPIVPGRMRVRREVALAPPPVLIPTRIRMRRAIALPFPQPTPAIPKRRGRAPSHIPDPWSDLEWENHPRAHEAVRSHPTGMTLEEIGAWMGITRERVRQIEHTALRKLKMNTGDDVTRVGRLTMAIPDCEKCGEPYMRMRGRQTLCEACEGKRKRKRPIPTYGVQQPAYAAMH